MNNPQGHEDATRRARFETMYGEHHARVLAYVLRRTDRPDDAADALAETFLVAWRRLDDVPAGDLARPWLYGVARRVLANQRRGERRRTKLADRVRDELSARLPLDAPPSENGSFAAAFRSLPDDDREVLALVAWEGLDPREIATVLDVSRNAARIRLHRARRRLRAALAATGDPGAPGGAARATSSQLTDPSGRRHPDRHERVSAAVLVIGGEAP